jgi:2',3'-cyclic-nucleotide 2'-phosphodiesterase (5'-nucleotidase family)
MRRLILAAICGVGCVHSQPQAPPPAANPVPGPRAIIETAVPAAPRLRVIALNDLHGALEPRPDATGAMRGGAATVAGAIKAARSGCNPPDCATILLDAGDEFQGTPASNLAFGKPVVDIFNYLGLSAAALGNHEFDWTQDTLRSIMNAAKYPILGANVRYADGSDVPWIPNDTILARGPIRVGIIGISTVETPTTTLPENVADLRFVDPVPVIDSIAPALRARGAQVVIVIAHAGGSCRAAACHGEIIDIANRISAAVDVIIAGHSHTLINTVVRGVPVVEARSRGQAIDVLDLMVGPPVVATLHEVRDLYTDSIAQNPDIVDIVRRATALVAPIVNRPITTIAEPMRVSGNQYALGNLIADAMRVVGHGNIGMMNNGGIRQSLQAGPATYGSLFEIQPFANTLVRVRVRGRDLRVFLERSLQSGVPDFHISGARVVYHTAPSVGIDSINIGGRPLDDAAVYTVVQNNFNAIGGDNLGFGAAAISMDPVGVTDLDALITYLKSLPEPVRAPADQRFILRQ